MMKAAFRAILVSAAVTTVATASAQAAHVTRAWHVDRADPDSTLCREPQRANGGDDAPAGLLQRHPAAYAEAGGAERRRSGAVARTSAVERPEKVVHSPLSTGVLRTATV